jgi:hypothetical protein
VVSALNSVDFSAPHRYPVTDFKSQTMAWISFEPIYWTQEFGDYQDATLNGRSLNVKGRLASGSETPSMIVLIATRCFASP